MNGLLILRKTVAGEPGAGGERDAAPEHRRVQGRATVDFYGVDDEQSFCDFIQGQQK